MNSSISAMTDVNCSISGQRAKSRMDNIQTFEVYGCADCSGCKHKAHCLYKYDSKKDAEKNKVMKINEQWEKLKERSHANILADA